jgi:hypothetical protein
MNDARSRYKRFLILMDLFLFVDFDCTFERSYEQLLILSSLDLLLFVECDFDFDFEG